MNRMSNMMEGGGNSFVQGGIILLLINTVSGWLRQVVGYIFQYLFAAVFVSVDVNNSEDAYRWLVEYLSHLAKEGKVNSWGQMSIVCDQVHTKPKG